MQLKTKIAFIYKCVKQNSPHQNKKSFEYFHKFFQYKMNFTRNWIYSVNFFLFWKYFQNFCEYIHEFCHLKIIVTHFCENIHILMVKLKIFSELFLPLKTFSKLLNIFTFLTFKCIEILFHQINSKKKFNEKSEYIRANFFGEIGPSWFLRKRWFKDYLNTWNFKCLDR